MVSWLCEEAEKFNLDIKMPVDLRPFNTIMGDNEDIPIEEKLERQETDRDSFKIGRAHV